MPYNDSLLRNEPGTHKQQSAMQTDKVVLRLYAARAYSNATVGRAQNSSKLPAHSPNWASAQLIEAACTIPNTISLDVHAAWREIRMHEAVRVQMPDTQKHAPSEVAVLGRRYNTTPRKTPGTKRGVH